MSERRVVVTGMGALTPIGLNVGDFWKNALEGKSGVAEIQKINAKEDGYSTYIAGECDEFDTSQCFRDQKLLKRMDPFIIYALYAAKEAIDDAGIKLKDGDDPSRYGVIVGSGIGGLKTLTDQHKNLMEAGPRRINPFLIPMLITNMAAGAISMEYGYTGANYSISTACATANHAIGESKMIIERGEADVMISGAAEAAIVGIGLGGFCSARALSTRNNEPERASRPFDKERDGFVMGEGAGILVLEELEHAKARGANIYAEVVGFGMTSDAYHVTAPREDGDGAAKSMKKAMEMAKVNPEQIDYINAHGTSTPTGDICETTAIKKALGSSANDVLISSTKSMTGHLLGAAGGVEAIACIKSMNDSKVHPTINLENFDERCDLNYVPNEAVDKEVNYALSNSFGFGGHNATLALKKY